MTRTVNRPTRSCLVVGGIFALTLLAGCTSNGDEHAMSASPRFAPATPAMPAGPGDQPGGEMPVIIDLTQDNLAVPGTVDPVIIDTRTFANQRQLPAFSDGPVTFIKNELPEHKRPSTVPAGPMNLEDFEIGEITDARRVAPAMQFPAIGRTPWQPPDPALAVGPDHVVVTVNMAVAFYDKNGVEQFSAPLNDTGDPGFFETIGAGGFTFDPKCYYDHYSQRYFILALEYYSPSESWITFAVSDDDDPNGIWYKYRTPSVVNVSGTTYWVDYPGMGFDQEGFYVTGNLFRLSGGGPGFGGVLFRLFDKTPLLSGSAAAWNDIRRGDAASVQCAQHFGSNLAAFFVSVQSSSQMRVWGIENPTTAPVINTFDVSIPSFSGDNVDAPNLGGNTVTTLPGRIMNAAWRDSKLVLAHTTNVGGRAVARWYEINTRNWPAPSADPILLQSGSVDAGPGNHTFFPAVYSNAAGDIAMVMARSNANQYVSMEATARKSADAPGTMGALQQLTIGNSSASGRWGDYFDIAVDPNNDTTFWMVGERETSNGWQTWVSELTTVSCPADLTGSSDQNDPSFAKPDGDVDGDDFFFYLDAFAAGALNRCDFTGSADPNDPSFGNPDGDCDGEDFFFYLDLFSQGCS